MDLEHKHHGNKLGRKSSNIPTRGIFRSRKKKEKDDERHVLNTYMRRK